MMTRTLILALSLTVAGVPAVAAAETESATTIVRTDDLKLSSVRGQQRLDARIEYAAHRLCRSDRRGAADSRMEAQCIATAVAQAKPGAARAVAQARRDGRLALLMVDTAR